MNVLRDSPESHMASAYGRARRTPMTAVIGARLGRIDNRHMRLPSPALPALLFVVLCPAATLLAQTAARPDLPPVDLQVRDTTRVESWQYFDPKPGGGNPDYTFPATRLFASLDFRRPAVDVVGAVQYVQFASLPAHSIGPGPLGTG